MATPCPTNSYLRVEATGAVTVSVHVVPNASRTEADGLHDGALRVRLHAPPVDGKANEAVAAWLADTLKVRRSEVALIRGQTSRRKQLRVTPDAASHAHWDALVTSGSTKTKP
ncbi:MAG: DUF167 domain-containing protein [Burkholderiaceae bacterium]|nr:DUF167 domain-containing protein [Burkholderiaceae bacterium]